MYALQTVGSTTSSVKDDTEVLELDDAGNSIVEQIISNSNAIKRSGNLTANGFQSSQSHPAIHNYEQDNVDKNDSVGLCFWAIFQAVGLTCVATIICRSIIYKNGFFDGSSTPNSTTITKDQFCNWHYSLNTIGFIYLYANSIFMIKRNKSNVTLPYIMLHTFAFVISALGLCAMYVHKNIEVRPPGTKFYQGHVYSIHSWTGMLAAAMFTAQWLSAVVTFMMPCVHNLGLPLGKMFSLYTILVSTISLVAGLNQHAFKTLKDEYRTYSTQSLVLNGFGMSIMLFLILTTYVIIKPNKK